jgi:hypothetical protein
MCVLCAGSMHTVADRSRVRRTTKGQMLQVHCARVCVGFWARLGCGVVCCGACRNVSQFPHCGNCDRHSLITANNSLNNRQQRAPEEFHFSEVSFS